MAGFGSSSDYDNPEGLSESELLQLANLVMAMGGEEEEAEEEEETVPVLLGEVLLQDDPVYALLPTAEAGLDYDYSDDYDDAYLPRSRRGATDQDDYLDQLGWGGKQ